MVRVHSGLPYLRYMRALSNVGGLYSTLATLVLLVHALFILWVVFGAIVARSRPVLRGLHIASLLWAILVEVVPWLPCPLTLLENHLEQKGRIDPYHGGFLLHYMDKLVYPDVSATVLTIVAVAVCLLNLALYARVFLARRTR